MLQAIPHRSALHAYRLETQVPVLIKNVQTISIYLQEIQDE